MIANLICLTFCFPLVVLLSAIYKSLTKAHHHHRPNHSQHKRGPTAAAGVTVTPVSRHFKYQTQPPERFRPFTKKGHTYQWSMALHAIDKNDLFIVDKEYPKIVQLREKCVSKYSELSIGYVRGQNKEQEMMMREVIEEVYEFVVCFMMTRYPMYFKKKRVKTAAKVIVVVVENKITGVHLPIDVSHLSIDSILKLIAVTVTEDFLILFKDTQDKGNDEDEYRLKSYISCAPGGLEISNKLNKPITTIHKPIPGFLNKLQFAMNKFFNRLPAGKQYMSRNNWFLQYTTPPRMFYFVAESKKNIDHEMNSVHFPLASTISTPGPGQGPGPEPEPLPEPDFNQVFLRTEKQSFIKLPKTQTMIMIVKTHVTDLFTIRDDENCGLELSDSIDAIQGEQRDYKGVNYWGEPIKRFLNHETNGSCEERYEYEFDM